jgi:hypothetical protein
MLVSVSRGRMSRLPKINSASLPVVTHPQMSSSQPPAGPSRLPQRPPPTASPLPQPIRRAVRAAQPARAAPSPTPPANPRAKSLFGSFKCKQALADVCLIRTDLIALSPNVRIAVGLAGIGIGVAGLMVDRFVLPDQEGEKPLISVRTVDRE